MMRNYHYMAGAIAVGLSVGLLGCGSLSASEPTVEESAQSIITAQGIPTTGQALDVSAQVTIADQVIQLEVARTPQEQSTGLMFRTELADDRGMLFLFNAPRVARFWMKNVPISLDMVFMQDGEVVAIAADVPPCTTPTCPTYGPDGMVNQVLELRGGRAAELGIQEGDRLTIEYLPSN